MELSKVTQQPEGQAKIQTQGKLLPQLHTSLPGVPASACGLLQVSPDAFCSLNQPVWAQAC